MAICGGTVINIVGLFAFQSLPSACTADAVIESVKAYFFSNLGAAEQRSILLVYTLYSLTMDNDRYQDKSLLPLRDPEGLQHGFTGVGDITLSDNNGNLFECIQVAGVLLTPALAEEAFVYNDNRETLRQTCDTIYQTYDREVIVDGLMPMLSYGVRSLPKPADSLAAYRQAFRENKAA